MTNLGLSVEARCAYRLGAITILLSSCNIGSGIADFGNDLANQPTVTVGNGQRLATGHYSSPLVDPWDDNGPVIIAFEYLDDGPHLAMRPWDGSPGCDTGIAYSSVVRDKLDNRTQLAAYQDGGQKDQDGGVVSCRGAVHFVDHSCKEYGPPIQNANLPDLLYSDPPGYLVNAASCTIIDNTPTITATQLLVVDPWDGTSTVLAGNLTWWKVMPQDESTIAVIDGGHYKVFNAQQQVTSDIGTAVTEIAFLSGQGAGFALVDGGTLSTYSSVTDTAPVAISTDACQPVSDPGGCLFYFSPCAARQLQCYRADTGKSTPIDSGVSVPVSSQVTSGNPNFFAIYTKPDTQNSSSDLWLYSSGATPVQTVTSFFGLYAWNPPPNLEIDALVNADANQGQAIRHTTAGDVLLVDSVSVKFSPGLLANFDATSSIGDLYSPLQLGQAPQFVIAGVPYVPNRSTIVTSKNTDTVSYGTAVISSATTGVGNLTLLRYPSATSPGPESPRVVATGVPVQGYKFFQYMNALAYTENWNSDAGTGSLVILDLDLDAHTAVSDNVREFQEVYWPSEGVMYIIPTGDQAGIWVAKAK